MAHLESGFLINRKFGSASFRRTGLIRGSDVWTDPNVSALGLAVAQELGNVSHHENNLRSLCATFSGHLGSVATTPFHSVGARCVSC